MPGVAEPGTRRGANGRKAVQRRGHVQLRNRIPADRQGPEDVSRHRFVVRRRTVLQTERSVKPNPSTDRSVTFASHNIVKTRRERFFFNFSILSSNLNANDIALFWQQRKVGKRTEEKKRTKAGKS